MAPAPDMLTLAARLATFEGPKQVPKRRASSSNKKKQQSSSVSWPHKSPAPEELAEAGFFYKPTADSHDSVTCYLCGKSLDGWEEGDNPAREHLSHVPDCGWAVNVCIGHRREDEDRAEEDPLSEPMTDARTATFGEQWPHEGKKGWKPKVKKMVEAGWCYNPLPEYDDCVMCFYCGTSLDGWEPKDDPMKEHKKRAEDCHFFTLVEESKKSKRGKGKRAARGSKASRASTMTVDSEQVSFAGTDLDDPTAEGESMLSTTSTASRATRGRSRTVKGKSTRATKAAKQDSFLELALDEPAAEESAAPEQTSKRGRTKRATAQKGDDSGLGAADAEPEAKPKKAPTRARTKQAAKDDLIIEPDASMISTQTETRTTRGRKRTSDGKEKLDSSVILVEEKPATRPASKSKSKRAPPNKKPVDIAIDEEPQFEEPAAQTESAAEEEPQPSKPAKKKAASRKQKSSESEQTYSKAPMQSCLTEDGGDKENPQSLARKPIASPERPASKPTQIFSPSPQSSDAENVPPSSRPSAGKRAPLSPVHQLQQPLQTPRTSPSKRNNTIGGLKSTAPWTQIDLDAALLPSPTAAAAWAPQHMKLDEVLDSMTSPEKQMTVEAWILHNASRAETALRNECERMIVQFEDEGNRAVQAVEGIDCVS